MIIFKKDAVMETAAVPVKNKDKEVVNESGIGGNQQESTG